MKHLSMLDWVALILVVIGGINWGFIGIFDIDIVSSVFGVMTMITRTIYIIIGVSVLYEVVILSTKTD